jgi:TP901 family phage tail tape measure protein
VARDVVVDIKASTAQYERAMGRATRQTGGLSSKLGQVAKVGAALGGAAVVAGVAALGAAVVKVGVDAAKGFAQFETSLAQIEGLVGVAREDLDAMTVDLKELAVEAGRGPQELADALFFITSAGLEGADAMDALEVSAKAATAGLGDTATIADVVTSAMNAYGSDVLSAAQSTDVLVAAVREGKAAAPELSGALGQVIPIASSMGVRFDEVGASIAAMTRTGLNAAEASTALKSILTSILAPSTDAAKALDGLGLSASGLQDQIRSEGLFATLQTLAERFDGNTEATTRVFGNVRALTGVLSLMGSNAAATEEIFDSLASSTGALDTAFGAAADTGAFAFAQAKASIEVALLEVGEQILPKLADAMDRIAPLLPELVGGIGDLAIAAVEFGTSAVPAIIDGFSVLEKTVINSQIAIQKVRSGWGDFVDFMDVAGGPLLNYGDAFDEVAEDHLQWLKAQRQVNEVMRQTGDASHAATNALLLLADETAINEERTAALGNQLALTDQEMLDAAQYAYDYAAAHGASEAELGSLTIAIAYLEEQLRGEAAAESLAAIETERASIIRKYAADAAGEEADAIDGELVPALQTYQDVLEDALVAQESLADAMKAAADPAFKAVKAVEKLGKANDDLAEVQADGTSTAEDIAAAQLAVVEATLEAQGALDAVDGQAMEAALDAIATALGIGDDEARDLLVTLGLIDGTEVTTVINIETRETRIADAEREAIVRRYGPEPEPSVNYALGGVVPGPLGAPRLAVVHGGEEVLTPAQRVEGTSSNMGRGAVTVVIERPETNDLQGDVTAGLTMASVVQQVDFLGGE